MVPIIGFCGKSGSGKTTLLERLIAELSRRGLCVGAVKHHGHTGPVVEPAVLQGKDSGRLAQAGAARILFVHQDGVSLAADSVESGLPVEQLAAHYLDGLDLVLVEGFKGADIPKVEVVAPGEEPLLPSGGKLLALARAGGSGSEAGLPVLDADDTAALVDFVLGQASAQVREDIMGISLTFSVGGQELDLPLAEARLVAHVLRGVLHRRKAEGVAAPDGPVEVRLA